MARPPPGSPCVIGQLGPPVFLPICGSPAGKDTTAGLGSGVESREERELVSPDGFHQPQRDGQEKGHRRNSLVVTLSPCKSLKSLSHQLGTRANQVDKITRTRPRKPEDDVLSSSEAHPGRAYKSTGCGTTPECGVSRAGPQESDSGPCSAAIQEATLWGSKA